MSLEYHPVKEGRAIAPWVRALKGKSGCYIIRKKMAFYFLPGKSYTLENRIPADLTPPCFAIFKSGVARRRGRHLQCQKLRLRLCAAPLPAHLICRTP